VQHAWWITSQLPTKQWHEHLADQTIADAILDRILNNAHRLVLKGPTRRNPDAKEKKDTDK
jgi:DNA replication protein DnaC